MSENTAGYIDFNPNNVMHSCQKVVYFRTKIGSFAYLKRWNICLNTGEVGLISIVFGVKYFKYFFIDTLEPGITYI